MRSFRRRPNLIARQGEMHPPPVLVPPRDGRFSARLQWWLRRLLDLQLGSIWSDMMAELPALRGRVLDAGCGAQPYRSLLHRSVEYLGIDSAAAPSDFGYQQPDALYFSGTTWPVADDWADAVLCTETLEHVADPLAFLNEAWRCLKPGGRLILTVPFAARWHFAPFDYWRFTPSGLGQLLTRAGFEDVFVASRGNSWTVAAYKWLALFWPLLLPPPGRRRTHPGKRLWAAPAAIPVLGLALLGNASFAMGGDEDCLGYTAAARKPASGG